MAIRLIAMRRVLKETGSICLHCDPTASHYLKLVMDAIFGMKNFRNEIIWSYRTGGTSKRAFAKKHDVILIYSKSSKYKFNQQKERSYTKSKHRKPGVINYGKGVAEFFEDEYGVFNLVNMRDVWDIPYINSQSKERLGYPTQKPLALLDIIVKTLSDEKDLVLDPFCGCGTTVHMAEALERNWIGIDISSFSVGLIRKRILNNFEGKVSPEDIESRGLPHNLAMARKLAQKDKFEFEKWVCGAIGAHGMFHNPGERGPDGGVDGVIEFGLFSGSTEKIEIERCYAIVQVKGGKVSPDSVRGLYSTVKKFNATAGILVCFDEYMTTVQNNRNRDTYRDLTGVYPVIQGFSIEQLLGHEKPEMPTLTFQDNTKLRGDLF